MNKEQENNENTAKAVGKDLGISTKMSVEVCSFIRKKKVGKAKVMLEKVINEKQAVPIKGFNKGLAHKKKIGPGRYPKKVCEEMLKLLSQVQANAQFKGLSTDDLIITHIKADKATTPWHQGRKRRRKMKRTHIEIIVTEGMKKKTEDKGKKKEIKEEKKEPEKVEEKTGKKEEKVGEKETKTEKKAEEKSKRDDGKKK